MADLLRAEGVDRRRRGKDQRAREESGKLGLISPLGAAIGGIAAPLAIIIRAHDLTMPVDVVTEITIRRDSREVAHFASDPDNARRWYTNIKDVEWKTPRPLRVGSRMAFVARFLGRRLVYTYEVAEYVPGERLVMRTAQGPFPMETTYEFEARGPSMSRMRLRNRGEPSGFAKLLTPVLAMAMRIANRKDLTRLKDILEHAA